MITALVFTVIIVALVVFAALAVFLAEDSDGAMHKPHWPARCPPAPSSRLTPFQALIAALDTAGRLLHIRWPGWLINWAWHRQATPGPDELARKLARKTRAGKHAGPVKP